MSLICDIPSFVIQLEETQRRKYSVIHMMDPVAEANLKAIAYRNDPSGFQTTYNSSYIDVPTFYASPAYDKLRQQKQKRESGERLSYRNSTDANYDFDRRRDEAGYTERIEKEELYRREIERLEAERRSPYRGQPRDILPQRNSYGDGYPEPMTHRSRFDQYEDNFRGQNGFREAPLTHRSGQYEDRPSPQRQRFQEEHFRPDLRQEKEMGDYEPDELNGERRFCNRCFATGVCVYKFKCGHQYCGPCLGRLRGSENPFRGSWLWHYKCAICKHDEWCSEQRLIKYAPGGRRIF